MKIAKVFAGDPNNQKGQFNNIIERTKRLKAVEPNLDCFIIRFQYGWFIGALKGRFSPKKKSEKTVVCGLEFRNIWVTLGLIDYVITHRLGLKLAIANRQLRRYVPLFKKYDLLSVHTHEAMVLASSVKDQFGIPFVATWHGSDIHALPFRNEQSRKQASKIIDTADHNFFVSKKLMSVAYTLSSRTNKSVLYTGPADFFVRYTGEEINRIKSQYQIKHSYVVGFIGNLVPIKNVMVLPEIFKFMQECCACIDFVIVGDGELRELLSLRAKDLGVRNLHLVGNLKPEKVPEVLNCMDVLLLPSLNEGLPRVTLEAQACGVPVVGSNRGGIPEAIGDENCFELDQDFVANISKRAIELMRKDIVVSLPSQFSWEDALKSEKAYHEKAVANTLVQAGRRAPDRLVE